MSNLVLSANDIKKGKKGQARTSAAFIQPLQFLPLEDKDDDWKKNNMDWLEYQGLRQIWHKAPHFSKNYNLANGIIDKSDYISEGTDPNNQELLENLMSQEEETHLELRFYPIIPSFINTLCTEYSKRQTKYIFEATDEYSYNEMMAMKQEMIGNVLLRDAEQRMLEKMIEGGLDVKAPENQEQVQQQLSPENLKTLPEIEAYFKKNYRSMVEEWASHQQTEDIKRFSMEELEERNFRNSLITDSAYWHFLMKEDDYDVEIWNPMFTFVNKAPEVRYTSQAHSCGNILLLTIPEVIDKWGEIMNEEQLRSLELIHPATNALYPVTGYDPTSYYDVSQSHDWNVSGDSIAKREVTSMLDGPIGGGDMVSRLLHQHDYIGDGRNYLVRATTAYWKSQRKVGHLTAIKENGEPIIKIVDETYVVTDHPIYNNTLIENRNVDTLVFGEHIDWIWINQVWGGVKIGPNIPTYYGMPTVGASTGLQPIYIGINQNEIGPLKYQFKGDKTLYGCKLPVEGATFSDYNTRSTCPVDLLKPFQIGYNVVNNQIADILMDELGTIIVLDQNQLPQQSLGEDWGKGNYSKAYVAMKNFNILPLDKSLANQDGVSAQAPVHTLDASQTQRLLAKIQLAQYFKNEGLSLMGITPQRLGQPEGRQTATGVEENLNAAYAQTEKYFTQYSDYLMPRVHQMRTDLAQYYQSTKPSVRLQNITSKEERINFQINGTDLLLRDINIQCVSTAKNRNVVEELRKLLITNNTAGGTIYELGHLLTANSLGEMNTILKSIEDKANKQRQEEYAQQQQLQKQAEEATAREKQLQYDREAMEAEKDRRTRLLEAEIRSAGYGAAVDVNKNQQSDFIDAMQVIQGQQEFQDTMDLEREKHVAKTDLARNKENLAREKMNTQLRAKEIDLQISRENKTQYDLKAAHQKKKKETSNKKKGK